MTLETFISYSSKFIIFISLYFTIIWILVLLNSNQREKTNLKSYPSVSILIPAYNEENSIEKTIKSCLNLNYKGKLEIIVINDGSKDNTLKVIQKYVRQIKIIDKKNGGKADAVNYGIKTAIGEYIGVIDADSEIDPNSLTNAINMFYQKNEKQEIGGVISKMKPQNESGNLLERLQLIEYMMVGLMRYFLANFRLLHLTPGVLSIYKTKILKEIGGFDKNNLTEDFEVGVKIRKAGYLVEYSEDSCVYTNTPNTLKMFLNQRIRWSRGFIQTHKKHKDVFFNPKYGAFGIYQFPLNVFGPILYFLAIFTISFKIYKKLYEFIFKLIYTPDVLSWFAFDSLKDYILTINPKIDFIIIITFLIFMFLFYCVIRFYDYNFFKKHTLKKALAFIVYMMLYNYIHIIIYVISIRKELKKSKYDWGTK